jgi:hypothetical protein
MKGIHLLFLIAHCDIHKNSFQSSSRIAVILRAIKKFYVAEIAVRDFRPLLGHTEILLLGIWAE